MPQPGCLSRFVAKQAIEVVLADTAIGPAVLEQEAGQSRGHQAVLVPVGPGLDEGPLAAPPGHALRWAGQAASTRGSAQGAGVPPWGRSTGSLGARAAGTAGTTVRRDWARRDWVKGDWWVRSGWGWGWSRQRFRWRTDWMVPWGLQSSGLGPNGRAPWVGGTAPALGGSASLPRGVDSSPFSPQPPRPASASAANDQAPAMGPASHRPQPPVKRPRPGRSQAASA